MLFGARKTYRVETLGSSALRQVAAPIPEVTPEIRRLAEEMLGAMIAFEGIGLAAPQVGVLRRVVIVEPNPETTMTLVNPEILERSGAVEGMEGCLSVPDVWGIVVRPDHVVVRAQDRDGREFQFSADGYAARIVCHEVDHLDGVLFTDKAIRFVNPDGEDEE